MYPNYNDIILKKKQNEVIKNNIHLTIITLSKNDNKKFLRTLKSINSQKIDLKVEWLIIDGSLKKIQEKKIKLIDKFFNKKHLNSFLIKHINSNEKGKFGIFPCMNYGKKIAKGKFIMFLNSGDKFFNIHSLKIILEKSLLQRKNNCLIFGQANIVASNKLNWVFPGNKLSNHKKWIKFFEPNHQAMVVSSNLAGIFEFPNDMESISDGFWKRLIIENAQEIFYIKIPIIKFFLDGISSKKPTTKEFLKIINNKKINLLRKIIFLIKYIFPKRLFFLYHLLQKYKSLLVDFIF